MAKRIRRPYMINGTKVWLTGATEQEILENAIKLIGIQPVHIQEPSSVKHNFGEYVTNWFQKYSKPTVSTATATTYERQLRLYILPALGGKNVEDITLDDVQQLFNSIKGAMGTKIKCRIVLNMIFKLAVEEELMRRNLLESSSFRIKGEARKETPAYSVEEMRFLVERIGSLPNRDDRAYLALHALHPLRLEEVLGLRWEDVDEKEMILHIRRAVTHPKRNAPEVKETKTGKPRETALSSVCLGHLKAIGFGQPEEYIVGGEFPCSYTKLRGICKRIKKETGFEGKISPIRFRTTVLTDIYEQTGDITLTQKAAGHATPEITLKHYIKGRKKANDAARVIDLAYATPQDV